MKPAPFEYVAPGDLDEVLALLTEHAGHARPLAGGQSLIPAMNFRLARPAMLVDLGQIEGLESIEETEGGGLAIGAMTRLSTLETSETVRRLQPLLREVMPWIAHHQIRTRGTAGGSVAHGDPAAELPAVLLALQAEVELASLAGRRRVPLLDVYLGPFLTCLEPGELLLKIHIPGPAPRHQGYDEFARRRGDFALAGVVACFDRGEDGSCRDVRIGLVNAGATSILATSAAEALEGIRPTPDAIGEAARRAAWTDAEPEADLHASVDYRRHLIEVLTRRTLDAALENGV